MYTKRYRHASQQQFQLDSINEVLQAIVRQQSLSCADNTLNTGLSITQTPTAVTIENSDDVASTALQFAPLFPGSFTQSDVSVKRVASPRQRMSPEITLLDDVRADNVSKDSTPTLGVLDPVLYFAKFNALPGKLSTRIARNSKPISIIIDESNNQATDTRQNIEQLLSELIHEINGCNDIIVIQLDINEPAHTQRRMMRSLPIHFQVSKHINVHHTVARSPQMLVSILAKSRIALTPSVALSMDAVNAGCPFVLYGEQTQPHSLSPCVKSSASYGSGNSTEEQRFQLAHYQMNKMQAHKLVCTRNHLYLALHQWITNPTEMPNSVLDTSKPLSASNAIIAVNSLPANKLVLGLRRTRSKCRKLMHSPRQFLQDSNIAGLRRLSNWGR